jgi:hypothetical protein
MHSDTDRKVASGWGAEEGKQELQAETDGYGDAKVDALFSPKSVAESPLYSSISHSVTFIHLVYIGCLGPR